MKVTMHRIIFLFLCIALLCGGSLWAQANEQQTVDTALNRKDTQGRRQGLWYIEKEAFRGNEGYIAFGRYVDSKKQGLWYRMDQLGRLISIKNFSNGVLNGTSQYYQKGNLVCIGNFRGLNPENEFDSIWVRNPISGYDTLVAIPSEKGSVKHGLWRYYSPVTGQLIAEEKYQVDNLLSRKEFQQKVTDSSSIPRQTHTPRHRPIDKKKYYHKVPERAKRRIGY